MIVVPLWHTSCFSHDPCFSSAFKLGRCRWNFPKTSSTYFNLVPSLLYLSEVIECGGTFPRSSVETACSLFSNSLCHCNKGLGRQLDIFAQVTILHTVPFFHFVLTHWTPVFLAFIPLCPYPCFSFCFWTFSLEICWLLLLALWVWVFIQLSTLILISLFTLPGLGGESLLLAPPL